ncbi:amino acid racemase [Cohnella sp. CFH 77786]|uniref:aspartate/glutamate racemase family protein n=1 Tax=Cohnella sp. CFH 77786 TaxID=2662265 RepID=UPI001C60B93D|nr:amino acid racemase [Cohnella sp. CFH 77786]
MENKRLGVIGGMGPKATSVFMDRIIEHTAAQRDQDHIDMIVLSHATLPDRTQVILKNEGDRFLKAVEPDFRLLEQAGAAHIAIPCNTSHFYIDEMQGMTRIPIINMVDETLREIAGRFGQRVKVGVLATNGTLRSGIYRMACEKHGMEYREPEASVQQQVMDMIYDVKKGVDVGSEALEALVRSLVEREGCQCVILACTELSCIKPNEHILQYCVDAMDVLVRKSIERSGKPFV